MGALSKKKGTNFKEGKAEAKGRDANDESAKKGTSRAMKMMFQMDGMFFIDMLQFWFFCLIQCFYFSIVDAK
ncbi:MAG: hypothetical protein ACI8RD_002297 [Bacillariaceae sp.]